MRKSLWFGCLFLLCTWGGPLAAQPAVDESDAPFFAYGTGTTSFNVEGSAVIEDLAVQVNIDCPYAIYTTLNVTSPAGTTINLTYYMGGYGDDIDCVFSDLGATVAPFNYSGTSGTPSQLDVNGGLVKPYSGTMSTAFDGEATEGEWDLYATTYYPSEVVLWGIKAYTVDPVSALTCSAGDDLGDVSLSWTNGPASDLDAVEIWHGGDMLFSLGAGDIDLAAGASNTIDAGTFPVPQQAEFRVIAILSGDSSQAASCVQSLMNDATASVGEMPAFDFGGDGPSYVGLFDMPTPSTTIGDIIVKIDYDHALPYLSQAYVASWSGTTVGLFDPYGNGHSNYFPVTTVDLSLWDLGKPWASVPIDEGNFMQPSGPGTLSDFVGEETIDPSTGEGTWAVVISTFEGTYYSGTVNEVGISIFDAAGGATSAPTGVSCDLTATLGGMVASWTNAGDYDSVVIFIDNIPVETLAGPFVEGESESYEFSSSSLPDQVGVGVVGEIGGRFSPPGTCSIVLVVEAPSGLTCTAVAGSSDDLAFVDLAWINPAADYYASIIISADGTDVDEIDGDATSWSSSDIGTEYAVPSVHQFGVRGTAASASSASSSCTIMLLPIAEIEACDSPDFASASYVDQVSDVTVSDAGTVESVEVTLNILGGYMYYAQWTLDAPSGTSLALHALYGAPTITTNSNFLMRLADGGEALSSLTLDELDDGLTVAPQNALSALIGEDVSGTWSFHNYNYLATSLQSWCLRLDFCSVLPPTDLTCETGPDSVSLGWFLGDTYDSIDIYMDDAVIDTVDGDTEFYDAKALEIGRHSFRVVGVNVSEGCNAPSNVCQAAVGFSEVCDSFPPTYLYTPGLDVELSFPDPIIVGKVEVVFDMVTGAYPYYYLIKLDSPYGTSIALHNHQAVYTLENFDLIWSEDGMANGYPWDCDGCLMKPSPGSLDAFVGEIADGDWILHIENYGVTGELNLGCVAIFEGCTATPPADVSCENVAGTKDILLTWVNGDSYDEVRIKRNGDTVATLAGSAEEYTDEGLLSDFYTYQAVGYDAGLDCESGSRFCETTVGITQVCNDTDVAGSGSAVSSTLEVTDDIAMDEVRVQVDADTPYSYMFTVKVESPSGTTVEMYKSYYAGGGLPGSYANFNCVFATNDDAASSPPASFDCDECMVSSTSSLSGLADESPVGTWTLTLTPFYTGYAATITDWCVQLMVGCPIGRPVITSCETKDGLPPVTVTWENADSYDGLSVARDGVVIATLSGDETSYTDADLTEGGFHTYRILADSLSLDCSKPSGTCSVGVGLISACSSPYSTLGAVIGMDFVDWQSAAVEEVLETNCIEGFDAGIAEAQISVNCDMDLYAYYIDLQVFSPEGTTVVLKEGGSTVTDGPDLMVTFASSGNPLSSSNDMCECLVLPTGPGTMDDFTGEDPRGEWIMLSGTSYTYYAGYLVDWCVEVFLGELPICPIVVDEEVWFKRGDCSNNGSFSGLADAQYLLNYAFNSGPTPGCLTACDASGNNTLSALPDALFMLSYAFQGGTIPPSPGPNTCGPDPQDPENGDAGGCATESATCNAAH